MSGIDSFVAEPHIFTDSIQAQAYEKVLQPGIVPVIKPNNPLNQSCLLRDI
jgi:hypothetical protein